ncbi:hypothetical protein [Quadrisphaera sp. INWT6]|uniref:hypothetical protein n=1 Tax=Quadrisphaera sp. INWT6 TaxID=2596917 RepID=UPI001892432C|nr:hypothetical protein [Quadrisphaera sp. INWT6]MBF5082627.1 hypothetical protein [Quadrisphaera sp. INWT6]
MSRPATARRGWGAALRAAVALGLASLTPDASTSAVLGSGTAWAGLLVLAGWLLRRPGRAAAAGVVVGLTAVAVHDGAGQLVGAFGASAWVDDRWWFAAAALAGGPLGLLGAAAHRPDRRGLLARLTVPAGAVLEPLVVGVPSTPVALALVTAGTVDAALVPSRPTGVSQVTGDRP